MFKYIFTLVIVGYASGILYTSYSTTQEKRHGDWSEGGYGMWLEQEEHLVEKYESGTYAEQVVPVKLAVHTKAYTKLLNKMAFYEGGLAPAYLLPLAKPEVEKMVANGFDPDSHTINGKLLNAYWWMNGRRDGDYTNTANVYHEVGIKNNFKCRSLLYEFVVFGDMDTVIWFVETYKPDLNVQDCYGRSLVHAALNKGWHNIAYYIMQQPEFDRSLINVESHGGDAVTATALDYAIAMPGVRMENYDPQWFPREGMVNYLRSVGAKSVRDNKQED